MAMPNGIGSAIFSSTSGSGAKKLSTPRKDRTGVREYWGGLAHPSHLVPASIGMAAPPFAVFEGWGVRLQLRLGCAA